MQTMVINAKNMMDVHMIQVHMVERYMDMVDMAHRKEVIVVHMREVKVLLMKDMILFDMNELILFDMNELILIYTQDVIVFVGKEIIVLYKKDKLASRKVHMVVTCMYNNDRDILHNPRKDTMELLVQGLRNDKKFERIEKENAMKYVDCI